MSIMVVPNLSVIVRLKGEKAHSDAPDGRYTINTV